ncbi:MAG: hypothetical protein J6X55_14695 [Victivallales bacterium]|nr:hypothetical protein [Victivallales bacterium]
MTNYQKRIIAACVVGIVLATAFFFLVKTDILVICAYAVALLDMVLATASLWQLSKTSKSGYVTDMAFVLALKCSLALSLILAVVFVCLDISGLWVMPWIWYLAIQMVILAFTAWRMLAIGAGAEAIKNVGKEVAANVTSWKMLQADADALKREAPEALVKDISAVCDAIRYADPMSKPEVASIDDTIKKIIGDLKGMVHEEKADEAKVLCINIQNSIRDRAERLKSLK